MAHKEGQQHPISVYLWIWGLLFVLSTASYLVDYYEFESYLRWFLILLFMILKAGLIMKNVEEGIRPWGNPLGAAQFGSTFFMITGFHGFHVSVGVLFLLITARKVWRGDYDTNKRGFFTSKKGNYEAVEIMGLYWHFVDLVWVFIFALFYLW